MTDAGEPGRATVRATEDVGAIMGADLEEYNLSAGDVADLPVPNARALVDRGAAQVVGGLDDSRADGRQNCGGSAGGGGNGGGGGGGDGGDPARGGGEDGFDIVAAFEAACESYQIHPGGVAAIDSRPAPVAEILGGEDVADAIHTFRRNADQLDGTDKQAVIGEVLAGALAHAGEFFRTENGRLYYFDGEESTVHRVDVDGNRVLGEDFQALVTDRYNLLAGQFSRNLGQDLKNHIRRSAPEREVYDFAHYDGDEPELYVADWRDGYYVVTPETVEWRPNGTDLFFLPNDRAESYEYLPPDERPDLPPPGGLPAELPRWVGGGDPVMRVFGNRIAFSDDAALSPPQQRKQLYLYLHTLPFIDRLNARPIVAWVGGKGSGKTVIQRSIGQWVFGPGYAESIMPDSRDDLVAKVSNQPLAFIDNYDDGVDWANDVLAAVATGAGVDRRELYTTNDLYQSRPRCWLSLTSRDPPFRRDDVADRCLVHRLERVEDADTGHDGGENVVGMEDYLQVAARYRNLLWSVYLDNLQAVVAALASADTASRGTSHRMADWAILADVTADALGVERVGELLETMETERAVFALENEPWAGVVEQWVRSDPDDAATWRKAASLADRLKDFADEQDRTFTLTDARALGGKFGQYHSELSAIYGLEVDDSKRTNRYRFADGEAGSEPTGLNKYT